MELTLQDLRELLAANPSTQTCQLLAPEGTLTIAVLQRGWVAVGKFHQSGDICELREASVVRRWGTTAGLGQLASEGPQPNTILDPVPRGVRFHVLAAIAVFTCAPERWGSTR